MHILGNRAAWRRTFARILVVVGVLVAGAMATSTPAQADPCGGQGWSCTGGRSNGVGYQFQTQGTNGYNSAFYCGPASTRLALTARGYYYGQDQLASALGTTPSGTNDISLVTNVLNAYANTGWYESKYIPYPYSQWYVDRLRADVVLDIDYGFAIVANVKGTATDYYGNAHSYPNGHYLTVVGFHQNGNVVEIEDVAISTGGTHQYPMTLSQLAYWIASKGYSA